MEQFWGWEHTGRCQSSLLRQHYGLTPGRQAQWTIVDGGEEIFKGMKLSAI